MTITNGYITLLELKQADVVNIATADTVSDTLLEQIIMAASRTIDADTCRKFFKNSNDETRYYTANDEYSLTDIDDIVSITTLSTDNSNTRSYTAWVSGDYELSPYNAALDGWPYTTIDVIPTSSVTFPLTKKGVKITGIFGFPAVPQKIKQATMQLSARMFKRLSTPLGVASLSEMGEVTVSIKDKDPDYYHYILEFRKTR